MTAYANRTVFHSGWGFYKGNLHSHSTVSDGALTHEQIIERYKAQGYSFLCFSDHEIYTDLTALDTPEFITLPGVEWAAYPKELKNGAWEQTHHMHGIAGTRRMLANASQPPLQHNERMPSINFGGIESLEWMREYLTERGCFLIYNHPRWSRTAPADFGTLQGFTAMEVYNNTCELESHTGLGDVYWDMLLDGGNRIFGVATDDSHNRLQPDDSFGGWICVNASALEHDEIVQSVLDGRYYSSNGPVIHQVGVRDGKVYVNCEPVHHINFVMSGGVGFGASAWSADGGNSLTEAAYTLRGQEGYVRVECVDMFGRTAWSNPIFPDSE